jgi:hypothetical protein
LTSALAPSTGEDGPIRPTLRATAGSGWLPASLVALAAVAVLIGYGTPIVQVALFAGYVVFGITLPGMLLVRWARGRPMHIAEDLLMGLAAGYCIEIATYVAARAVGAPLLFMLWPILTLVGFTAAPGLRRYWRSGGVRAPTWWSWSLAAMVGYLLIYSAGTFFGQHHLTGPDAPYLDMPYHLALIGELRQHVPPEVPYVSGLPLAYHWFFYAEAAATSWATGIDPFVTFVVLTAATARRLTGGWWTGPVAVAIALFGTVAGPYGWIPGSVPDTQTLLATWISPTNLLGLALFAALILALVDRLDSDRAGARSQWILVALLVFGVAGAKASLIPLLIVGLLVALAGVAIGRRRIDRTAAASLGLAIAGLVLATIAVYRGTSGGLSVGVSALESFAVANSVGARHTTGIARVAAPIITLVVAFGLWSFLWAGAYGLLTRRRTARIGPAILLLLGICAAALGAVSIFLYPGQSQLYYLRGAAGAFGLVTATGVSDLVPERPRLGPLIAAASVAALIGAGAATAVAALGSTVAPRFGADRLVNVVATLVLPVLILAAIAAVSFLAARSAERRAPMIRGIVPLLLVALVMGYSVPRVVAVVGSPFIGGPVSNTEIPGDGILAARWLAEHSDPSDLVATNLHCAPMPVTPGTCDARHFWVSGYAQRRVLVEGWAYTAPAFRYGLAHDVSDRTAPFWDPALLAANDAAFTDPSPGTLAELRDRSGVRWLFADLTGADQDALGRNAELRFRRGDFAVYELR